MPKKIMSMLLTLLFTCLAFSVSVSLDFPRTAHDFFSGLSNHFHGLRRTFSEICKKFDALPLSDPSQNRVSPDTRLQIKGHRKSAHHSAA
jgi:hypothetical protein